MPDPGAPPGRAARVLGTALALSAHLLLGVTVWYLFPFLMTARPAEPGTTHPGWWWSNALLVLGFGLPHSLLLYPAIRRRLERRIPRALYGCVFTVTTCTSLLALIHLWQPSAVVLGEATGEARWVIHGLYVLSWVGMVYGLSLSGFGYQTGWTPYWHWVRGQALPARRFEARGAFRLLRHPVYLSFLGQVWFTPVWTADRLLLVGLLTAYIALGSMLKDRRLTLYLGDVYRRYQAQVPGYPLARGPLGRVPLLAGAGIAPTPDAGCATNTRPGEPASPAPSGAG